MIEIVFGTLLFFTVLSVGLAVDHARSSARKERSAWNLLVQYERPTTDRTKSRHRETARRSTRRERVFIFGAGDAGVRLASELGSRRDIELVGFLDDNLELRNNFIDGLRVYAAQSMLELIRRHRASRIILALPSEAEQRRRSIIATLGNLSIHVQSIPSAAELSAGRARIDDLREIDIADIVGRDVVAAGQGSGDKTIRRRSVMVTGAGGSIGTELCLRIVRLGASRLVLFDVSEQALYEIDRQLREIVSSESIDIEIAPLLGSVNNQKRLEEALNAYAVDTVYHAAASKYVPLVEYNMIEGVSNNVLGTLHAANAAIAAGVKWFVLISTDKAVRPTSVMGASKRLAEQIVQSSNDRNTDTSFSVVRFGNVLGSSGSVIPLFREQIRRGGPVTISHPEIIRYFMSVTEAAELVLQASSLAQGGEVFVLDMGVPVRISDLAAAMIRLSGFSVRDASNPDGDIEIGYVGLRPGEKLFEELFIESKVRASDNPRIMIYQEDYPSWDILEKLIADLGEFCSKLDRDGVRKLLVKAVPEYNPTTGVEDLVWRQIGESDRLEALGSDHIYESSDGKPGGLAQIIQLERYRA